MSNESRRLAGILLIVLPTVMFGGLSILSLLIGDPDYIKNPLRQDLWRAGHAHAGVWLILALVALRYVDEARLSDAMKWVVRASLPIAAILVPAGFFFSVLPPDATAPNALIYLVYVGAALLAIGVLVLGVGPSDGQAYDVQKHALACLSAAWHSIIEVQAVPAKELSRATLSKLARRVREAA